MKRPANILFRKRFSLHAVCKLRIRRISIVLLMVHLHHINMQVEYKCIHTYTHLWASLCVDLKLVDFDTLIVKFYTWVWHRCCKNVLLLSVSLICHQNCHCRLCCQSLSINRSLICYSCQSKVNHVIL